MSTEALHVPVASGGNGLLNVCVVVPVVGSYFAGLVPVARPLSLT